jgi:hypothetical protein
MAMVFRIASKKAVVLPQEIVMAMVFLIILTQIPMAMAFQMLMKIRAVQVLHHVHQRIPMAMAFQIIWI